MQRAVVCPMIVTMKANLEISVGEATPFAGVVAEADEFVPEASSGEPGSRGDAQVVVLAGVSAWYIAQGLGRGLREEAAVIPVFELLASLLRGERAPPCVSGLQHRRGIVGVVG
jgi:hypothetical protein